MAECFFQRPVWNPSSIDFADVSAIDALCAQLNCRLVFAEQAPQFRVIRFRMVPACGHKRDFELSDAAIADAIDSTVLIASGYRGSQHCYCVEQP